MGGLPHVDEGVTTMKGMKRGLPPWWGGGPHPYINPSLSSMWHTSWSSVVSSAGNTARAFAQVCSDNNINLLLTIPEDNLDALWFEKPLNPCVKVLATKSGSDYFDAINLGNIACEVEGFFAEGGAKNIARRDGMATTMLSATTFIGRIPDYYFQAVGSGTDLTKMLFMTWHVTPCLANLPV